MSPRGERRFKRGWFCFNAGIEDAGDGNFGTVSIWFVV